MTQRVKVAAFDFDGTLHYPARGKGELFDYPALEAIEAWQDAGHLAVSATGRSASALAFGLESLEGPALSFDYQVLSNGALATTSPAGDEGARLLFSYPIDPAILTAAIDTFGQREGVAVFATTDGPVDGVFANNTGTTSSLTAHFTPMTKADIPGHRFAVVPLWIPEDDALRAEVAEWAGSLPGVTVAQNHTYVDIMAQGRSKGSGILELLAAIGLDRADVELYTFGDSWNDLPMHEIADVSHSFTHSPADVQAATDRVVSSVAQALPGYM